MTKIQSELASLQQAEEDAVRACQEGLENISSDLLRRADQRVEELRKELHLYGALHIEPDLKGISARLADAVKDPSLTELFRIGGGLKVSDFHMS